MYAWGGPTLGSDPNGLATLPLKGAGAIGGLLLAGVVLIGGGVYIGGVVAGQWGPTITWPSLRTGPQTADPISPHDLPGYPPFTRPRDVPWPVLRPGRGPCSWLEDVYHQFCPYDRPNNVRFTPCACDDPDLVEKANRWCACAAFRIMALNCHARHGQGFTQSWMNHFIDMLDQLQKCADCLILLGK